MTADTPTPKLAPGARGWIGFDGECSLCQRWVRRWRPVLARRGFGFAPLQDAFWRERLSLPPGTLPEEMKLLLPDGRLLGGAEALVFLGRHVWWLAPLAGLAGLPGLRSLTFRGYRWLARHRRVEPVQPPEGWGRFCFELQHVGLLWFVSLLMLGCFRCGMIAYFGDQMRTKPAWSDLFQVAYWGWRFDSMVATYWILPSLVCAYLCYFRDARRLAAWVRSVTGVAMMASHLLICGITVEYYREYSDQFNQWVFGLFTDDLKAIGQTIWRQYPVLPYLGGTVLLLIGLTWGLRWLFRAFSARRERWVPDWKRPGQVVALALVLGFVFLALRGYGVRRPVKQRDFAVTRDLFLNKWVPNPYVALRYTLVLRQRVTGPGGIATFLGSRHISEAARQVYPEAGCWRDLDELSRRSAKGHRGAPPRHVFLLVCESYDGWIMLPEYRGLGLANELLRLADQGLSWRAFLPADASTIHAVSVLVTGLAETGLILNFQPASSRPFPTASAPAFKRLGYRTRFFYAGLTSWQRLDRFCTDQGFDEVIGLPHMGALPRHAVGTWGAHDEFLYRFVLEQVTDDTPSFNVVLTASNHGPFDCDVYRFGFPLRAMPAPYRERYDGAYPMIAFGHAWYTDKCAGDFVRQVERKFPRALFAITGDHQSRRYLNSRPAFFEQCTVPFVLYGPEALRGARPSPAAGSHLDVVPTLLELCAPPGFEYHSFGQDLLGSAPPETGFNGQALVTPRLIVPMRSSGVPEAIPGQSLPDPLPPLALLKEKALSVHALCWWRIKHGPALPPPPPNLSRP